jgi:hypothetical protein
MKTQQQLQERLNALLPQIMHDGVIYYLDGNGPLDIEFELMENAPRIKSTVPLFQVPNENGQANFNIEIGAPYTSHDGGIAVFWNNAWMFFTSLDVYAPVLTIGADEMPADFGFRIEFGTYGRNCIDTYSNTFTKDLVEAGSETIDFVIPYNVIRNIYEAFLEYRISELPDDINAEIEIIEGKTYSNVEPYREYVLNYICDGKTRTIVYNEGESWPVEDAPDTRDRLMGFVEYISNYIYSTEEYGKMSPAEGGYD